MNELNMIAHFKKKEGEDAPQLESSSSNTSVSATIIGIRCKLTRYKDPFIQSGLKVFSMQWQLSVVILIQLSSVIFKALDDLNRDRHIHVR